MALGTYQELIDSLSAWLDGGDLGGREADLIALCEDEINARLAAALQQGAFIRPMVEHGELTIDGEYVDLPDGNMVLPISIELNDFTPRREICFVSAGRMATLVAGEAANGRGAADADGAREPRFYTIVGDELRFHPAPSVPFPATFTRFSRMPALSAETASNWVLAGHRNAYLYGSLAQAELFGWNDARMANVATLFVQAMDGLVARYPAPVDRTPLIGGLDAFGAARAGPALTAFLSGEG